MTKNHTVAEWLRKNYRHTLLICQLSFPGQPTTPTTSATATCIVNNRFSAKLKENDYILDVYPAFAAEHHILPSIAMFLHKSEGKFLIKFSCLFSNSLMNSLISLTP